MRDHGTIDFKFVDDILFIKGCGPWNKEALSLFSENIDLPKKKDAPEKWGLLVHVVGDPIYTPDAVQVLVEHIKNEKKHGREATAFVLTDSTSPEIGKWHISDIYKQAGEVCQFFDSHEEATQWLKQLLR